MRGRRNSAAWVILAAAVSLAAPGCSALDRTPEKLTVGIVDIAATGLVHVARHAGYFRDAGVDVRYVPFDTGREALEALFEGRVDLATTFETPLVARALAGDRPRVLTTLHQSLRNTRVVVPKNRKILGPEDLRGRRVGVPRGTNAEYFLETLTMLAGLEPHDVRAVDVRAQDAAAALAKGQVDAVAVWYPLATCGHPPLDKLECVELFGDGYVEYTMLVTRDDVVENRDEAVRRFLRALSRAEHLVLERPDGALPALAAELPEGGGPHLAESWRRVTPQLGLDHLLLTILEREADWIASRMEAPPPPVDFRALLHPAPMLAVEPSAVTLLGGAR